MKKTLFVAGVGLLSFSGASLAQNTTTQTPTDQQVISLVNLPNVVGAQTISGNTFTGLESGEASVITSDQGTSVYGIFDNLPALNNTNFFYEGWVVDTSGATPAPLSTGELELDGNGDFVNHFTSTTNLEDHTVYVLTVEPRDGDPAPADAILNGPVVIPPTMAQLDALVTLNNIAGATTFGATTFAGTETGTASSIAGPTGTMVYAEFPNLPTPGANEFYEGWVVDTSGTSPVPTSTGELSLRGGIYVNSFATTTDLSSSTIYVLTLEPRDGNPAPADILLNGTVIATPAVTTTLIPTDQQVIGLKDLPNVIGTQTIGGTTFSGLETGMASLITSDQGTSVYAIFDSLTPLTANQFYEGWIVDTSGAAPVPQSTGELELDSNGDYVNHFTSTTNFEDHTLYVLTVEPRDGDPAPADHVLRGPVFVPASAAQLASLVTLNNIAGATTFGATTFSGNETGTASSVVDASGTMVYAEFPNLPTPGANEFYEGWVVDTSGTSPVPTSTGELSLRGGIYVNSFMTSADLSSSTVYVLTLEPRDGNPAPADILLNGTVIAAPAATTTLTPTSQQITGLKDLPNVIGTQTIDGTTFSGLETGMASLITSAQGTSVYAIFDNLTALNANQFYEGWIVDTSGATPVPQSTGELEFDSNGDYVNHFTSTTNFEDHTLYVLTVEPRDGDPAPADHVVRGPVFIDASPAQLGALVTLENVVGAQTIGATTFNGSEAGQASSVIDASGTMVYGEFTNLPLLGANEFYEGWVVDTSGSAPVPISTGELSLRNGQYINSFMTSADLSDHTFYVLTLEPRDGNPAPADHILREHVLTPPVMNVTNPNQGGGGGGSGRSSTTSGGLVLDSCPNGDNTVSRYDGACGNSIDDTEEEETVEVAATQETTTIETTQTVVNTTNTVVSNTTTSTDVVSVIEAVLETPTTPTISISDTMQKVIETLDAADYQGNTKLLLDLIVDYLSSRSIERQHELFDILSMRVAAIDSLKLLVVDIDKSTLVEVIDGVAAMIN